LDWINQRNQPLQQFLMDRMATVSIERRSIRKLHGDAKFVTLRARRKVDADASLEQTGNLALERANLRDRASFLILADACLPPKRKSMNDHAFIVINAYQIH